MIINIEIYDFSFTKVPHKKLSRVAIFFQGVKEKEIIRLGFKLGVLTVPSQKQFHHGNISVQKLPEICT